MARQAGGSGRVHSRKDTRLMPRLGPQVSAAVDLNRAKLEELAAHPLVGRRLEPDRRPPEAGIHLIAGAPLPCRPDRSPPAAEVRGLHLRSRRGFGR